MKNLNPTVAWIVRKYHKKIMIDLSFYVENIVIDIKQMYGVKVTVQKAYKAKRKILESVSSGDHVKSLKDLWDYAYIIKQHMPGALAMLKVTKSSTLQASAGFKGFLSVSQGLEMVSRWAVDHLLVLMDVI